MTCKRQIQAQKPNCFIAKPVLLCCVILPFCTFVWKMITFSLSLSYLLYVYSLSAHHVSGILTIIEMIETQSLPLRISQSSRGDKTVTSLYTCVHSSIVHNSQKGEATEVSIGRWMDKQMHAAVWMSLEDIGSEINQTQMDKYYMIQLTGGT